VAKRLTGSDTMFSIRPEKIHLGKVESQPEADMVSVEGVVRDVVYLGLFTRYLVETEGGNDLVVVEQKFKDNFDGCAFGEGAKSATALAQGSHEPGGRASSMLNRASTYLYRRPRLALALLLGPPMMYMVVVYLGSLFNLLVYSFYSLEGVHGFDRQKVHAVDVCPIV
jgi:hypothetical protein